MSCVTNTQSDLILRRAPRTGSPFFFFIAVEVERRESFAQLLGQLVTPYGAIPAACFNGVEATGIVEQQLLVQRSSALRIAFCFVEDKRQLEDGIVGEDVVKMEVDHFLQPVFAESNSPQLHAHGRTFHQDFIG